MADDTGTSAGCDTDRRGGPGGVRKVIGLCQRKLPSDIIHGTYFDPNPSDL